jgi:hypothetical protein
MTALCPRILQAALVYVNTLMLQDVLAEEERAAMLGPADRRDLTPLFWQRVRPYGEVRLGDGDYVHAAAQQIGAKRVPLGQRVRAGDAGDIRWYQKLVTRVQRDPAA